MRAKLQLVPKRNAPAPQRIAAETPRVGRLVGLDDRGHLKVEIPGVPGKLRARSLLRLDQALRRAVLNHAEVLLMFENGDLKRPIVAGILQPNSQDPSPADITAMSSVAGENPLVIEADSDGRRVTLKAQDEIVLQCGPASITLRRNGRVIIKGVQVDSTAEGTHRIRGGQVRLN